MDVLSNLHLILLSVLAVIDFILFNWAIIALFLAKGDTYKMQKSRRILIAALILFFVILLIITGFYIIGYFLGWEGPFGVTPSEQTGEFPYPSHISPFPPPPSEFVPLE